MAKEVNPAQTTRAAAFALWMNAPNPMVTILKTMDVTRLVKVGERRKMKFNALLCYCIGKAAAPIEEFYLLPVGGKLMRYDALAVNAIARNKDGGINSCDVPYAADLTEFHRLYLESVSQAAESCRDIDLSHDRMAIGTSAIIETEIDGVVGMNSGIYNNPFLFWGKYRRKLFRYDLPVSFQFHHTQMDGAHAGRFLENLQNEMRALR